MALVGVMALTSRVVMVGESTAPERVLKATNGSFNATDVIVPSGFFWFACHPMIARV